MTFKNKKKIFNKKSHKKRINKKGGSNFIDTNFMKCYSSNLVKVQKAISNFSGIHDIDQEVVKEFIENQTSPIRREAAKNFIANTIYITLQEVFDIIGSLIEQVYSQISDSETIYLYCGMPQKSFYFMSVIALFHIREKKYKEPIFVNSLNVDLFSTIGQSPLIILDDVSYSGAQLSELLNKIYINNMSLPPNIYVLLIALNENSKYKLSNVPSTKEKFSNLKPSPFKLIYLQERLYKPIISIIGIEKYVYLNLLFSPWTLNDNVPYVSIYLDHKIADPASTYTTTLLYGQIAPSNIDFKSMAYGDGNGYTDGMWFSGNISIYDENEKQRLLNELDSKYKNGNKVNFHEIINNFIQEDSTTQDKILNNLTFKPFVKSCNQNPVLLKNMTDPEIINLDYLIFMIPESCMEDKLNECLVYPNDIYTYLELKGLYTFEPKNGLTEEGLKIKSIHNKITSYKCPISWYKNGELVMGCLLGGKNKTNKKYYKKNGKTRKTRK